MANEAARLENTLIVAATTIEVRLVLERVGAWERVSAFRRIGWPIVELGRGNWVTISGIGKANAAGATAWAIATNSSSIERVINVGIAGVLPGGGLELGEVVVATESVFAEEGVRLPSGWEGVSALGFPLGDDDEKWSKGNRIRGDEGLSNEIANLIAKEDEGCVRRGVIATVACCSGTDGAAKEIVKRTGAIAEAMEGAAVVATARRLGRAAATEVRVISNTCGDRSNQRWDMKGAVGNVDQFLAAILA